MHERSGKRGRTEEDEPQLPNPKRGSLRKRAALACEECRVRKRRCDGMTPACSGCMRRMSVCVYSSEVQAREWHQNMIESLKTRLEELENDGACPKTAETHYRHLSTSASHDLIPKPSRSTQSKSSTADVQQPTGTNTALFKTVQDSPHGEAMDTTYNDDASLPVNQSIITAVEGCIDSPMSGHLESGQNMSPTRCIEPDSFERLMKPIDLAIDRTSDIATSMSIQPANTASTCILANETTDCTCEQSINAMQWCLPLRKHADALVSIYFSRHNRMLPVLHQPTFLEQYSRLWKSKANIKPTSELPCSGFCKQRSHGRLFPAMVYAVLALGALFESRALEQNAVRAEAYFQFVQGVDLLEALDDQVGIEVVQLGLLMGFYLQSTDKFSKCWNISGLTMRMAQNMGLHFDLAEARRRGLCTARPAKLESEMRSRVWYGCVLLETEISMYFGQPHVIPITSKKIKLPEAIEDDGLSDGLGRRHRHPDSIPGLLEYYVQSIKIYEILGMVLNKQDLDVGLCTIKVNSTIESILNLDGQLLDWRERLPVYLKYEPFLGEKNQHDNVPSGKLNHVQDVLDLPALSKRLYCRFLHSRQLILRPALELLFEKQQKDSTIGKTDSTGTKLPGSVLSQIAAECVLSACNLVDFLADQIQFHDFICWWVNISYLYTCGSTILMGRLCKFENATVLDKSLAKSWEVCLRYLARYTELSSIAKKSLHLLRESSKHLLSKDVQQKILDPIYEQPSFSDNQRLAIQVASFSDSTIPSTVDQVRTPLSKNDSSLPTKGFAEHDLFNAADLNVGHIEEDFGSELWNSEFNVSSTWPYMPFISQLETFPHTFDNTNILL